MGLDNIPREYACVSQGTAVRNLDTTINCAETQRNGGCPIINKKNSDPLVKDAIIALGMFGTDCWYRGKYGNFLLEDMQQWNPSFNPPFDFYGDESETEESSGGISPDGCIHLSDYMAEYTESWIQYVKSLQLDNKEEKDKINDWIYAAWWLKFVAENCEGSEIWY